mmetsp:Transcript_68970/g.183764  ORF Transcript_68970/g.183764 Transcript_68970/m.183764 type:complete len:758 (-) Transcript_68970:15-2288(-)
MTSLDLDDELFPAIPGHDQSFDCKNLVVNPDGHARLLWDLVALVLIAEASVVLPLDLAYSADVEFFPEIHTLVFWCLDIFLNFNTGFHDRQGNLVGSRYIIAKRYASSWLMVDFASTFPWQRVMEGGPKGSKLIRTTRIVKLIRCIRLLRILKLKAIIQTIAIKLGLDVRWLALQQVLALMICIVLLAHWAACVYLSVGLGADGPSWVKTMAVETASGEQQYTLALYWAILAMTDGPAFEASNRAEYCLAIIMCYFNMLVIASIVGSISSIVVSFNVDDGDFHARMRTLQGFLRDAQVPAGLQRKVRNYFAHTHEQARRIDDSDAVDTLSTSMRREIKYHLFGATLRTFPFFRDELGDGFIHEMVLHVRRTIYGPEDWVFRAGAPLLEMFFVAHGDIRLFLDEATPPMPRSGKRNKSAGKNRFRVLSSSSSTVNLVGNTIAPLLRRIRTGREQARPTRVQSQERQWEQIQSGQWFGEIALFAESPESSRRNVSAQCVTFCEVVVLSRENFDQVLSEQRDWFFATEDMRRKVGQKDPDALKMLKPAAPETRLAGPRVVDWRNSIRVDQLAEGRGWFSKWFRRKRTSTMEPPVPMQVPVKGEDENGHTSPNGSGSAGTVGLRAGSGSRRCARAASSEDILSNPKSDAGGDWSDTFSKDIGDEESVDEAGQIGAINSLALAPQDRQESGVSVASDVQAETPRFVSDLIGLMQAQHGQCLAMIQQLQEEMDLTREQVSREINSIAHRVRRFDNADHDMLIC